MIISRFSFTPLYLIQREGATATTPFPITISTKKTYENSPRILPVLSQDLNNYFKFWYGQYRRACGPALWLQYLRVKEANQSLLT